MKLDRFRRLKGATGCRKHPLWRPGPRCTLEKLVGVSKRIGVEIQCMHLKYPSVIVSGGLKQGKASEKVSRAAQGRVIKFPGL